MESSHSDWRVMVPHWGFDLHFSDYESCWASFHVFVSHLYVSLEKCLFRSLAHFLIGSFMFLELSCSCCLYIFEINPLSVSSFAIIFSHSEGCLFTLLIASFIVQNTQNFLLYYIQITQVDIQDPLLIFLLIHISVNLAHSPTNQAMLFFRSLDTSHTLYPIWPVTSYLPIAWLC